MCDPIVDQNVTRELTLRGAVGAPRIEQYYDEDYLVVPVVALMEGVIHAVNATTPEFVPGDRLALAAHTWNGRPLMLGHPARNGNQISANDPKVLQSSQFGQIFRSHMEGKKLIMEAWINPKRLIALGETKLLEDLKTGKVVEVSVGAHVTTVAKQGNFGGRDYKYEWRDITGDHLAFLPRGIGACSVKMGCGACRAAEEAETYLVTAEGFEILHDQEKPKGGNVNLFESLKALITKGKTEDVSDDEIRSAIDEHGQKVTVNVDGKQLAEAVKAAMDGMKKCAACEGTGKIGDKACEKCDGKGEMKAAAAVIKETFVAPEETAEAKADRILSEKAAAADAAFKAAHGNAKGATTMTSEQKTEVIKALIENKHSGFTAADEQMLALASDERLDQFRVAAEARAKEVEALKAAESRELTEDEFMRIAPASLKTLIMRQHRQETETKASLVATLKAAQEEYTESELAAMSIEALERLAKLVKVETPDYSGRALPRSASEGSTWKQNDVYMNPPDPYAAAIESRRKAN